MAFLRVTFYQMMFLLCMWIELGVLTNGIPLRNLSCRFSDLPRSVAGDRNNDDVDENGTILKVSCNDPFKEASPNTTCVNGSWTPPDPSCTLVECPYPVNPAGGFMQFFCRKFNCTTHFVCKEGFYYSGTLKRVCQRNETWSGTLGECKAVMCSVLSDPPNGYIRQTNRTYLGEATVVCDEGYVYRKPFSGTLKCLENNIWSGHEDELCEAVLCPSLPHPSNGKIHSPSRHYRSNATIECDMGYRFTNLASPTRQCQGDNTWSKQTGHCEAVRCPLLTNVADGKLSSLTGSYQGRSILQCDANYTLDGQGTLTCQANGNWSDVFGVCKLSGKETESTEKQLTIIISIVMVMLGLCIIAITICIWHRYDKRRSGPKMVMEEENIPFIMISGKSHYCSFTLTKDFNEEYQNEESPDYTVFKSLIKASLERNIKLELEVNGKVDDIIVCKGAKKVFVKIACITPISQADIVVALRQFLLKTSKATIYEIVPGSEVFRDFSDLPDMTDEYIDLSVYALTDSILHYLVANIHKKRHTPDKQLDKAIDLDTQYVRLKLLSSRTLGGVQFVERPDVYQQYLESHEGSDIQDEDIIKKDDVQKYILIRGRAGIGKSTLIQRLLWKWSNGKWATQFKAMFILNVRYLMTVDAPVNLGRLLMLYSVYSTVSSDSDDNWLEETQDSIAVVLDGIDEIMGFKQLWKTASPETNLSEKKTPLQWCFALMKRQCMRQSTIVVTSRPFADLGLVVNSMKDSHEQGRFMVLELMGLTSERITEFIEKNAPMNHQDFVKKTLMQNPILKSVCSITFYCAALCKVLGSSEVNAKRLITYTRITEFIMQMYIQRSVTSDNDVLNEDVRKEVASILALLRKLAFDGLLSHEKGGLPRLVFYEKDLEKFEDKKLKRHYSRNIGLLLQSEVQDPTNKDESQVQSQFVHLSMQEFLAVSGLLGKKPDDVRNIMAEFSRSQQYNMALLFLYGLAFDEDARMVREEALVELSAKPPREVTQVLLELSISDNLQALQVAHESQSKEVAEVVGRQRFPDEVSIEGSKLTAIDIIAITFMLRHNPDVNTVRLVDVGLDVTSVRKLSTFLRDNQTVKCLELSDQSLTDECLKTLLEDIQHNTAIEKLELNSESITDDGLKAFVEGLGNSSKIGVLALNCCKATGDGLSSVAKGIMGNETLTELFFASDTLDNDSVRRLSVVLKEKVMKKLSLYSDGVTDSCLERMGLALKDGTALEELRLDSANVSDSGVKNLLQGLTPACSLRVLCLRGFRMGNDGVEAVLKALATKCSLNLSMLRPDCADQLLKRIEGHPMITIV